MQQKIRTIGLRLSELEGRSLETLGFYGLTREIARLIAASGAAVLLLEKTGGQVIQSRALILDGEPVGNLGHDCLGTPCEYVAGGRELVISECLQRRFPNDRFLAKFGLQAYVGVPMKAADGRVFGLVAAYFRQPISDGELVLEVLRIAAGRLAIKLDARIGCRERTPVSSTVTAQQGSEFGSVGSQASCHDPVMTGQPGVRIRW